MKKTECLGMGGLGFVRQRVGVSISGKCYPPVPVPLKETHARIMNKTLPLVIG